VLSGTVGVRRTQRERRAQDRKTSPGCSADADRVRRLASMSLGRVGEEAGYSRGIVNHQFGTMDPAALAVVLLGQLRGIGLRLVLTPDPAPLEGDLTHAAIRRSTAI
jgi:hypothetical protein